MIFIAWQLAYNQRFVNLSVVCMKYFCNFIVKMFGV